MKKMLVLFVIALVAFLPNTYAGEDNMKTNTFDTVMKEAQVADGAKLIIYEQFKAIRSSKEPYILLDVLGPDSYAKGHIEGARSFPLETISDKTAAAMFPKDAQIIVYCASFQCTASTMGAKKLTGLGYKNVLDYKGGLKEWQEKGNELVK